jgi:hypothetical protein
MQRAQMRGFFRDGVYPIVFTAPAYRPLNGALQNLHRVALGIRPKMRRPTRGVKARALSPRRMATQRALIGATPSGSGSIPGFKRSLGRSVKSRNNRHMVGMMRDNWWWPWWVSTLIDLGVVVVALLVLRRASRRYLRGAALLVALVGVVAAVMAPIVMTDNPNQMKTDTPMMP